MSVLTALLEMMREEQMERQDDGDSTPEILQKLAGKGGEFAEALRTTAHSPRTRCRALYNACVGSTELRWGVAS